MKNSDFNIEQTMSFSLHHASYLVKTALKAEFKKAGHNVTTEEFVLLSLIPSEGIVQGKLREKSMKDKTNVTRLIDRLVKNGWVKREELKINRRHQVITLTTTGKEIQSQLAILAKKGIAKATKGISKEDIETTRKTLNELAKNLI